MFFVVRRLSDAEQCWIRELGPKNTGKRSFSDDWYPNRVLTNEDWEMLNRLVEKGVIFPQMTGSSYSFEVRFFSHPNNVHQNPTLLIIIPYCKLPRSFQVRGESNASKRIGQKLTHTDTNLAVLGFYNMSQAEPAECCY